ncbi:MAG: transglycosylase SLT domain-containing protein [Saprospiraceae bacterium]
MEPSSCKIYLVISLFLLVLTSSFAKATSEKPILNETEIIERLKAMESNVVEPRYDVVVKSYLRTYLVNARTLSENVIGRSVLFFPIFERYLQAHDLPTDLKYLAIVESALNPKAVSRARAVGLWQFMAPTAKELGLRMNSYVDERCDPERSTEAAMKHLSYLYSRFEDWPLVLAAYNSGSGRISRAVKRARSNNYWKVRRYLPRETHNYVPAFIAATYLLNYFEEHEINPSYPALDMQLTETIKVYTELRFDTLAQLTELPTEMITGLNPAYKKGVIPADPQGYYLTLPSRVMPLVKSYIEAKRPDNETNTVETVSIIIPNYSKILSADYEKGTYQVRGGETIEKVAQSLKCSVQELKAWNQLISNVITAGQRLIYFFPKENRKSTTMKKMEVQRTPALKPAPLHAPASSVRKLSADKAFQQDRFAYYILKRREKLRDIAERLNLSVEELEQINQMSGKRILPIGTVVKIKRL